METIGINVLLRQLIRRSMLPLMAACAFLGVAFVQEIHDQQNQAAEHRLDIATNTLNDFLEARIAGLTLLSSSPQLASVQLLEGFRGRAEKFRDNWGHHLMLANADRQMLMHTRLPADAPLPQLPLPRSPGYSAFQAALVSGKVSVGDIVTSPIMGESVAVIAAPVLRDGIAAQALMAVIEAGQVETLLSRVKLPEGFVVSVIDGKGDRFASAPRTDVHQFRKLALSGSRPVAATGERWRLELHTDPTLNHSTVLLAGSALMLGLLVAIGLAYYLSLSFAGTLTHAMGSLASPEGIPAAGEVPQITEVEAVRSKLKESALMLNASETRYAELFRSNPHPMWIYDLETLRFLAVNNAAVARYGYSQDEFLAMTIADIRPAEDVPKLRDNIEKRRHLLKGSFDHAGIWRHRKKDGSLISVEISSHILQFDGRRAEAVLAHDVTDRLQVEERIAGYMHRLEQAMSGTAQAIAGMMDQRDPYTAGHERRVGEIAAAIAAEMGLPEETQRGLRVAGDLHDIGKISVPAEILAKPARLTAVEFELIKQHAEKGYDILKSIDFPWPVAEIAHQHHERLDGSGYPRGLKGDQILPEARILAVADVLEAMSSHRPYRPGLGLDKALEEIEKNSGRHYDPAVVSACLRLCRERGYRIPA